MNTNQDIFSGSFSFLNSKYFNPAYLFSKMSVFFQDAFSYIFSKQAGQAFVVIATVLSIFFIAIICYTIVRMLEIRKKEHAHLHHEIEEYAHNKTEYDTRLHEEAGGSKNEHWGKVLTYLFSQHASDWKLAIIEADTMLEGMLVQMGFQGESIGDRLKSSNQDTFPQLTIAWEVHTIRNRIAHEGLAFELSQHEAKRVIALYEQIFYAYGYI